jgi:hypothetical protein
VKDGTAALIARASAIADAGQSRISRRSLSMAGNITQIIPRCPYCLSNEDVEKEYDSEEDRRDDQRFHWRCRNPNAGCGSFWPDVKKKQHGR